MSSPKKARIQVLKPKHEASPVLALPTSLAVPPNVDFEVYTKDNNPSMLLSDSSRDASVDWQASALQDPQSFKYALGVRDKRDGSVKLLPSELYLAKPSARQQRSRALQPQAASDTAADRKALGTAFGTRKAIRSFNARERDHIDSSSTDTLSNLQPLLQNSISQTTDYLDNVPAELVNNDLAALFPPHDFKATDLEKVYPLNGLISSGEMEAIQNVIGNTDPIDLISNSRRNLPFSSKSSFINSLKSTFEGLKNSGLMSPSRKRTLAASVYALSFHFVFKTTHQLDRGKLSEKFPDIPAVILDGMLERFTVTPRADQSRKLTETGHAKLTLYMLALMFHLSTTFSIDIPTAAKDFQIPAAKLRHYAKLLGCRFSDSPSQDSGSRSKDTAVLKFPLPYTSTKDIKNRKTFARK